MTPEEIADLNATFAKQVLAHRSIKGLTRAELSRMSGLNEGAIDVIERGRTRPNGTRGPKRRVSVGEAVALARALDVPMREMLNPAGGR